MKRFEWSCYIDWNPTLNFVNRSLTGTAGIKKGDVKFIDALVRSANRKIHREGIASSLVRPKHFKVEYVIGGPFYVYTAELVCGIYINGLVALRYRLPCGWPGDGRRIPESCFE